jgi:hypothetical protein
LLFDRKSLFQARVVVSGKDKSPLVAINWGRFRFAGSAIKPPAGSFIQHPMFTKKTTVRAGMLSILSLLTWNTSVSLAGSADTDDKQVTATLTPPIAASPISGFFNVTVASDYLSRGITVINHGVVIQPDLGLSLSLYQGDGFINNFAVTLETWNNVSTDTERARPGGSIKWWEEFDAIPGFSLKFARRFTLYATYDYYASPAGRYNYGNHLNNYIVFDDTGLLVKNFALLPRFTFLYELPGSVPTGIKGNGWYFSPSLEPSYTFFSNTPYTLTFSVPVSVGLGHRFYNGTNYGYFNVGPKLAAPISFLPASLGKWNASVGYTYWNLGRTTAALPLAEGRHYRNVVYTSVGLTF